MRHSLMRATLAVAAAWFMTVSCLADTHSGVRALQGTWKFNPGKSLFQGAMPYRSGTYTFRDTRDGIKVIAHIIEGNGQVLHFEYIDRQDESYVPVTGNPFYDSESTRWTHSGDATRRERRQGSVTGQTTMRVARDGRSFTASARRTLPDGGLYISRIVWDKLDDHVAAAESKVR